MPQTFTHATDWITFNLRPWTSGEADVLSEWFNSRWSETIFGKAYRYWVFVYH